MSVGGGAYFQKVTQMLLHMDSDGHMTTETVATDFWITNDVNLRRIVCACLCERLVVLGPWNH